MAEVLVALLIMSIGLVSLATLFPLSVLQTVKASQMTNATDLRYNAEALIDLFPFIIKNPVYRPLTKNSPNPASLADPLLQPNYVVDPLGFVSVQNLNTTLGGTVADGPNANAPYTNHPEHYFGNTGAVPWRTIPRYPLYWFQQPFASSIATLPDSWLNQYENFRYVPNGAPAADGSTQINVTGLSNSGFALPGGAAAQTTRAVIFSADGLSSQVRTILVVNGDMISWSENTLGQDINNNGIKDDYPLPTTFVNGGIGNIRIDTQDRRYTWLLTVRQSAAGLGSVDVVVFFNRYFETIGDDELLYPASFGFNAANNAASQTVYVTYTPPQKPFMRKGGFVFDAANAYWYRISNVADNGTGQATLTVETPIYSSITSAKGGRAMFPRGVVDVFPIGSKSFP